MPKSSRADNSGADSLPEPRKSGIVRRWLIRLSLCIAILVLIPIVLVPVYIVVDPPVSAVMIIKRLGGAPMTRQWVGMDAISPHLARSVLVAEDGRFCAHNGVDFTEMRKVFDRAAAGSRLRGASTITMQSVKNLFLWPQRSWLRKALEFPLALYADALWTKRRTMEIYLNVAEWDFGVYGAQAAARHHFGVPAARLTAAQAARLAAVLPDPRNREPARPSRHTGRLARLYAARAARSGAYIACLE